MDDLKQAKSGVKISGVVLLIGAMVLIAAGYNQATIILLWIFAPILLVSFVLFFLFLYRVYKLKQK
jgi:hypothetical protein